MSGWTKMGRRKGAERGTAESGKGIVKKELYSFGGKRDERKMRKGGEK